MKIIADASPLIALAILQKLDLLDALFTEVWLPSAVFHEATIYAKPHAQTIQSYAENKVVPVENQIAVQLLTNDIDLGEAEAIVLALEQGVSDSLIDDAKGRRIAQLNGLFPIGTIGVLLQAKRKDLIAGVKPHLDTLMKNHIRVGKNLYMRALQLAGESA
ncbi:MAG: DUF3368 domain-containing protein [Chloroflexi bacterium]|nr:DUF3368 domain-containing protein [Chloroflexota bacterium]